MSKENVELVRRMYRPGDPSRFFDLLDEEVEVDTSSFGGLPDHPGLVQGKRAVVKYFRSYWGAWDDYVLEPTEVIEVGENGVVAVHYERGRGRGSGVPFEQRWATAYTLRAAKIISFEAHPTLEGALEAAARE
jgi:ketosteroid isomerase-like protein